MARPANPNKTAPTVRRTTVNLGDMADIVNGILAGQNTVEERQAAINIFDNVLKVSGQNPLSYWHLDALSVPEGETPGIILDMVKRTKSVGDTTRRFYNLPDCPRSAPKVATKEVATTTPDKDGEDYIDDGNPL